MNRFSLVVVATGLLFSLGCRTRLPTATSGSLAITIEGSSSADVIVNGPGGFSAAVNTSTTLSDLAEGSYSLIARPVRIPGASVDTLANPSTPTASVTVVSVKRAASRCRTWPTASVDVSGPRLSPTPASKRSETFRFTTRAPASRM